LTTNFDPLIVEALAVTGQPIRTYDLNTTGKYHPGTLDPDSLDDDGLLKTYLRHNNPCDHHYDRGQHTKLIADRLRSALDSLRLDRA
jgi:hypothetical protein